jgi:hypothetical protein
MITTEQQLVLFQVNALFQKLESMANAQQMEKFHMMWFNLFPGREIFPEEHHLRSLERERRFREMQQQHRL